MNVYLISGLAVDRRVFQKLELPPRFIIRYIDWLRPLPRETTLHFAQRLSSLIDTSQPFALVGMSFGGMMATVMNRFVHPRKTIIISSAATKNELPPYFKLAGWLGLHRIVPNAFLKNPNFLFHWLFGITTKEEKKLFKDILHDADPRVVRWSVNAVVHWQHTEVPENLVHIHGNADLLLPVRWAKPHITVEGGNHFMIFSKAGVLSKIICELLEEAEKSEVGSRKSEDESL